MSMMEKNYFFVVMGVGRFSSENQKNGKKTSR
jgi:hypothetical protein